MAVREPATFGGPGWRGRTGTHRDEVAAGSAWRRCGGASEVARLRDVVLTWPSDALGRVEEPDAWLMLGRPDLERLRVQVRALAEVYASRGVRVHWMRSEGGELPPNAIFARDLAFLTPEGAVLARPASGVRAGEERFMAARLAALGVPILRTLTGEATFEGADALWVDPQTVLLGVGTRTNEAGARAVEEVLRDQGVGVVRVPLPPGTQHLLGVVNLVDRDLAAIDGLRRVPVLEAALKACGVAVLPMEDSTELRERRSLNFVTLAPREVVMPSGCPRTRGALEAAGVACTDLNMSEAIVAGGGMGCMTAVVWRSV